MQLLSRMRLKLSQLLYTSINKDHKWRVQQDKSTWIWSLLQHIKLCSPTERKWPCSFLQFEANCFLQDGNIWKSTAVSHQQGFSNWAGLQRMSPLCSDTAGSDTTYSTLQTVMHNNFIVLNWTWKQPKAMRRRGYEKSMLSAQRVCHTQRVSETGE